MQFVRKADAEMAIEKMQGFPIGGGRVRLSWGRSQCASTVLPEAGRGVSDPRRYLTADKAAQAAAQAAQLGINLGQLGTLQGLSESHTAQLLQSLGLAGGSEVSANDAASLSQAILAQHGYAGDPTGGERDGYDYRGVTSSNSTTSIQDVSSLGSQLSRSHTFPSFAPFGSDGSTYSSLSSLAASRTIAGINPQQSQHQSYQQNGDGGAYALPTSASRGSMNGAGRNMDTLSNGFGGFAYFDGSQGGRTSSGFQVSDILRQERAGSDSTVATSASDATPPSQHYAGGAEVHDLSNSLASLNFGQYDPYRQQYAEAKTAAGAFSYAPSSKSQNTPLNKA